MKLLLLILTFGVISYPRPSASASDFGQATPTCPRMRHVLITAFEPFAQQRQNSTQLLADTLKLIKTEENCIQFDVCVLPVEFKRGAKKAIRCFKELPNKPDLVISTGEGPDCDIHVETKAYDLDNDPMTFDNRHEKKINKIIDRFGPTDMVFTLPVADMYCAAKATLKANIRPSQSDGYFVCNDVAYRFGFFLRREGVPFGFIHAPRASACKINFPLLASSVVKMTREVYFALAKGPAKFRTDYRDLTIDGDSPDPLARACYAEMAEDLRRQEAAQKAAAHPRSGDVQNWQRHRR